MAMGIEHQVSVSGLAQAGRTVREPLDVASRCTPKGPRLVLAHEELTPLLGRARKIQEIHRVEVTQHLHTTMSTLNPLVCRYYSRED